ncbi:MAG: NAD(P)H-dependent oxidoreductase subunit E [Bacteroidetes bacterium]|nr:NAD(P)H-dependent oxidoreductase subunit E [Bacteroidota bacterium]
METFEKNPTNSGENRHKQLDRALIRQQGRRGALIEVLHETQNIFGYLPRDVLAYIAQTLKLPPSHVYGVASFYPSFRFSPPARHSITVCMGTACYVNGSSSLLKETESACDCPANKTRDDLLFSVQAAHCLGSCGSGPVIRTEHGTQSCANVEQVGAIIAALREDAG